MFIVASLMNAAAASIAWFVLRPMRRKQMLEATQVPVDAEPAGAKNAYAT